MKKNLLRVLRIILDLFLAAVTLTLSQIIVYYPMYGILGSSISYPFWTAIYSILSYLLAIILLISIIWATSGQKRPRILQKIFPNTAMPTGIRNILGLEGLPKWSDILLAPIGLFCYTAFATILTGLFSKFPFFNADETQNLGFSSDPYFTQDKILAFVALVIIAPIVEELIFRGWLYTRLRARIPGKASMFLSILLTSILFGILHGQWNVGINVFCLSVILCCLREITGSTYAGILLHILKNGLAFWLLYMI